MRTYFTAILLVVTYFAYGQKMPDYGLHKIRLVDSGVTIVAEIQPLTSAPSPKINLWYYWYSSEKIHTLMGGYSGKLLNGDYLKYNINHNLIESGHFNAGLKNGIFKEWNDKGLLIQLTTWKKGILSGAFLYFNSNGTPKQAGRFKGDTTLEGVITYYHGKDSIKKVKYKNGKPIPTDTSSFFRRINVFKKKKKND